MRILIKNAMILPMDEPGHQISNGYIIVENGRIKSLGEGDSAETAFDKVIDADGKAALPGFVNAHTHAAMVLLRGYADDMPLMDWLQYKIWPVEAKLNGDDIYWGTMLAAVEMIKSGTTCFNDMYFYMDDAARAVEDSGIRAVINRGMIGVGPEAEIAFPESSRMVEKWHGAAGGRITCKLGPHAPYTCPPPYLERVVKLAEELKVGLHIHIAETLAEIETIKNDYGCSPVEYLERCGIFKLPVTAAHCVHVSPSDMETLKKYNVGVAHCPESNMKLGSGFAPVKEMLELGIQVGLGTDGASSNNDQDMLQEMRSAAFLQKVKNYDPTVIPAYTALEMVTRNGAIALGLDDEIGQLKPGYKADLILIDCAGAHMQPLHELAANLVYCAHSSDVETVIIDGVVVMENRTINTLDEKEVIKKAAAVARDLVNRP